MEGRLHWCGHYDFMTQIRSLDTTLAKRECCSRLLLIVVLAFTSSSSILASIAITGLT